MARRTAAVVLGALALGGFLLPVGGRTAQAAASQEVVYRRIVTPVQGPFRYANDWAAPRDGGAREHLGNDLMGSKLQPLLAARDGVVSWTRTDGNNMLSIRDEHGWSYVYIHINNDTPGTDDGANPREWMFFPGIERGARVRAGQPVAYMGDSGNAESTAPHLHFEMRKPDGTHVNPYWSLMLSQGRRVHDRCAFDGNPEGTPSAAAGGGYWATTADGGVYSYGSAPFHGSMGGRPLARPVIGLTPTRSGRGYWQLAADGGIFSFGDARFHGSTGAMRLNRPIVGMAATPTGGGYWLVASDGGIFSFGDAGFHGSTGGRTASPVVAMAASPTGRGYWLLTRGGSVLAYGDAAWVGEPARIGFCETPVVVSLAPTRTGRGYWVQSTRGDTFALGDAADHGSIRRSALAAAPSVGLAASR